MNQNDYPAHEPDEKLPEPQPEPPASSPGWDPAEQVGDIYRVDLEPGQPPEVQRLSEPPQIWVGSWLDYNNGLLHGEWIDAARDSDEVWTDIAAMLAASPTASRYGETAEDWGIFDFDNFGGFRVGENETVERVTAIARGIAEHGPAFAAWAELTDDPDDLERFGDAYLGEYESVEAFTEQLLDDLGYTEQLDAALPEHIRRHVEINTAGLAQDMWLSGDIQICHTPDGRVWLFDGR
jgi:antirestriction protein